MRAPTTEIEHSCPGTLIAGNAKVSVPLTFKTDPADPWAVTLTVGSEAASVSWVFDKNLLEQGTKTPAGLGAVVCWPNEQEQTTYITLNNDHKTATLTVDTENIIEFLKQTPTEKTCTETTQKQINDFLTTLP